MLTRFVILCDKIRESIMIRENIGLGVSLYDRDEQFCDDFCDDAYMHQICFWT